MPRPFSFESLGIELPFDPSALGEADFIHPELKINPEKDIVFASMNEDEKRLYTVVKKLQQASCSDPSSIKRKEFALKASALGSLLQALVRDNHELWSMKKIQMAQDFLLAVIVAPDEEESREVETSIL